MKCAKKWTEWEVKKLLEYNEHQPGNDNNDDNNNNNNNNKEVTVEVPTMHGPMRLAVATDAPTGHARARHLAITTHGLKVRTKDPETGAKSQDGMQAQGIELASAFERGQPGDLITAVTEVLNSQRGQEGLSALDQYEHQGRTRILIVESAAAIGCQHLKARVFYQDEFEVKTEPITSIAVVVDSNHGGTWPIKIVTAFPCKGNPRLEVGLSYLMARVRDAAKKVAPLDEPIVDLLKKCAMWLKKSRTNIPPDLLHGNAFVIGEVINQGWFKPAAAVFRYQYPPQVEDQGPPKRYARVMGGRPGESRMSRVRLEALAGERGIKLLAVDYGRKIVTMLEK